MTEQIPPHHTENEAAALGCVLDCDDPGKLFSELSIDLFYDQRHRYIFTSILTLSRENPISIVGLVEQLSRSKTLDRAGGFAYVQSLPEAKISTAQWPAYLESLRDHAARRAAIRDGQSIIEIARDPAQDWRAVQKASQTLFQAHARNGHDNGHLSHRTPHELINLQFKDDDCILGDRLLARGQPMTILAPGGTGKSRLVIQMAAAIIVGRDFLTFSTNGRATRWLFLQTENSNRRLQSDLHRIKAWLTPDEWHLFCQCTLFHTIEHEEDGMVFLSDDRNREEISYLIDSFRPDIIPWDPLGDFAIGDPNKDQDMRETVRAIATLTKRGNPDRCAIPVHHAITGKLGAAKATGYDRSSFGRNSKVLHSWTRGQINIAPGSPDDNSSLVVSCGKCSNGKEFQTFAIKLNLDTMIYELDDSFDLTQWQSDVTGSKLTSDITPSKIRDLCPVSGCEKREFSTLIRNEYGCSTATSYRWIDKSVKSKHLNRARNTGLFYKGDSL